MFSEEAFALYTDFNHKPGGSHIAKPTTIDFLIQFCKSEKPRYILELGGGIGTLTFTALKYSNAHVDVYEQNDFCKEQLLKNVSSVRGEDRLTLIDIYTTLPPRRDYDLMIIDGGEAQDHQHGYAETVWLFINYLNSLKAIYVDGRRPAQRKQARMALRNKGYYKLTRHKDLMYKGQNYMGGLEFKIYPHKSKLVQLANYYFWETLIFLNKLRFSFLRFLKF